MDRTQMARLIIVISLLLSSCTIKSNPKETTAPTIHTQKSETEPSITITATYVPETTQDTEHTDPTIETTTETIVYNQPTPTASKNNDYSDVNTEVNEYFPTEHIADQAPENNLPAEDVDEGENFTPWG